MTYITLKKTYLLMYCDRYVFATVRAPRGAARCERPVIPYSFLVVSSVVTQLFIDDCCGDRTGPHWGHECIELIKVTYIYAEREILSSPFHHSVTLFPVLSPVPRNVHSRFRPALGLVCDEARAQGKWFTSIS